VSRKEQIALGPLSLDIAFDSNACSCGHVLYKKLLMKCCTV